jgi:hypothetical protein
MSNTIACPTIWEITVNSMKKLGVSYFSHINKLYQQTTPEHQHAYLDLLAHSKVMLSMKNREQICWTERSIKANSPCPPALTLIMRALHDRVPLEVTKTQATYFATTEQLEAAQQEVLEQNTWATQNKYAFDMKFQCDSSNNSKKTITPPGITFEYNWEYTWNIAALFCSPPEYAPLAVTWAFDGTPMYTHAYKRSQGYKDLQHQIDLWGYGMRQIMSVITVLNSPEPIIRKVMSKKKLNNEELFILSETLEKLYPIRARAYEAIKNKTGYAVLLPEEVIIPSEGMFGVPNPEKGHNPVTIPPKTRKWLRNKMTEPPAMMLDTNPCLL